MTRVLWTLEDLTHTRPLSPTSSSQGTSCCRSERISLWGASSLRGRGSTSAQLGVGLRSQPRRLLPSDQPQRDGEEQPSFSKRPHPVGPAGTVHTRQLRLHVSVGNDELSKHQVAHLCQVRQGAGLSHVMAGRKAHLGLLLSPERWVGSSWWLPRRPGKTAPPARCLRHPP